jgi:hypothetical protein
LGVFTPAERQQASLPTELILIIGRGLSSIKRTFAVFDIKKYVK